MDKNIHKSFFLVLLLQSLLILTTCKKFEKVMMVTTGTVEDITTNSATVSGKVIDLGEGTFIARGTCWSTVSSPTTSDEKMAHGTGAGSYSITISNLEPNTSYFLRAYLITSEATSYGDEISFTTFATIETTLITSIALDSAVSGGNIPSDGNGTITGRGVCWATNENPTINNFKTTDGTGTGSFASILPGLQPGTTYFVRAYATNITGTSYGNQFIFNTKIDDVEGNIYNTVKIGSRIWMAENLRTTLFQDNAVIPYITNNTTWATLTTPAYCYYNNDDVNNKARYGALYNWYAVNTNKLCPSGWHVPTDAEWIILIDYLINNNYGYGGSGDDIAKSMAATNGWAISTLTGAVGNDQVNNNRSGFSAIPGGLRHSTGVFELIVTGADFWSSAGYDVSNAWHYWLLYDDQTIRINYDLKRVGNSVRCIKN